MTRHVLRQINAIATVLVFRLALHGDLRFITILNGIANTNRIGLLKSNIQVVK